MKMIFTSLKVIKWVCFDVVFTTRQSSSAHIWWSFLFLTDAVGDEEANEIYLFLGEFFAEEIDDDEDETPDIDDEDETSDIDDEDETPDIKRRRVIASSDEEEPNEEPPDEEPALNDDDYYDSDDYPKCYQHPLVCCECLPPLPPRADDEIAVSTTISSVGVFALGRI